jgi:ATP-dependent protease HslVU (ClpYQ) peptidase subunit
MLACDSAADNNSRGLVTKIYTTPNYLIGFAGQISEMQRLVTCAEWPETFDEKSLIVFINEWLKDPQDDEDGTDMLIATKDALYAVEWMSVNTHQKEWSIGSGQHVALGYFEALNNSGVQIGIKHLKEAAEAAAKYDPSCAAPVKFATL